MFTNKLVEIITRCAYSKVRRNNWPIDSEDLAQETLMRVYKAVATGSFVPESSVDLERYCKRSLYTTGVDIIRHAKAAKRDGDVVSISILSGEADEGKDAELIDTSDINNEALEDVYEAARSLSERQRRIIELYAAGHTLAETVQVLESEGVKASIGLVSYERKNAI